MFRLLLLVTTLFLHNKCSVDAFSAIYHPRVLPKPFALFSSNKSDNDSMKASAFPVGTFVEFEEKKRMHIGKFLEHENKSNGSVRYEVEDSEGKHFGIPDKAVTFAVPAPNSPGAATKLFDEFCKANEFSEQELQSKLAITPELLEIAWEESEAEDDSILTPIGLIELIHAHAASAIEKYMAWKLLKTDMAHVFFKEIKDHGRVIAFKAKARKAVDAAKQTFCNAHDDTDFCMV